MEQVNNHYHGSVTIVGSSAQSHYVPAEKPYAVYAYVWEGPTTAIAQLIGTMLVGKPDKEGELKFEGKAVYRMPSNRMIDFEHCFIPEDMGELEGDPIYLGFVGDTVGLEEVALVKRLDLNLSEGLYSPESIVSDMRCAGLKVEMPERTEFHTVDCECFAEYQSDYERNDIYLEVNKQAPIRVKIWEASSNKSNKGYRVFGILKSQLEAWQKVGVSVFGLKMKRNDSIFHQQLDELWALTRVYARYEDDDFHLEHLLRCRDVLGTGRCSYDDFIDATMKAMYSDYQKGDQDLQWAIDNGLATREGNIIQFSDDVERMAEWKWDWPDGGDGNSPSEE